MIHTKIHAVLEGLASRATGPAWAQQLGAAYKETPHYVLTDDLVRVMKADTVTATIRALMDAGVARLPYKFCLVELNQTTIQGSRGRAFVWLGEDEDCPQQWFAHLTFLHPDGRVVGMHAGCRIRLGYAQVGELSHEEVEANHGVMFEIKPTQETLDNTMVFALGVLLTLTHTRGVAKEEVTSETLRKLNKARASRGKHEVLPYTLYKIGHVYTSKGDKVTYAPGCKMRPHLRAGHTRRQRYGSGRNETKIVFIEPVLVNCASMDEVQMRPRVVSC